MSHTFYQIAFIQVCHYTCCLTLEISTATTKPPHGPTPSTSAAGPVVKIQTWPTSMFIAKQLLLQAPPPFPDQDPPATTGPSTA